MKENTLILTLEMEAEAQLYFTELRTTFFPRHCNYLQAHITLFHRLPDVMVVENIIKEFTNRSTFELDVTAVKNIGNGVAYVIQSKELQELHAAMQLSLAAWLIPQDKNILWPHVTIQNKVTAYKAKQTAELLQKDFKAFTIKAIGIGSWLYLGGPWERKATYLFQK